MKQSAIYAAILLLLTIAPAQGREATGLPNIVFILADDLGYGDVGCYGHAGNKTPHIDALAEGGLRFTDFHSAGPMCTPTRAATLTGLYQQRFGRMFDGAISGKTQHDSGLPLAAVTIAEVLRDRGYVTGCFGKWHLGFKPPYLPPSQGFDAFRGLGSGDGDHFTHVDRSGRPDWWHNNTLGPEPGYTTDLLTKHSIDFIGRHRDRPFFLYLAHLAIHFPWQGPHDPPHRQLGTDYWNDKWGAIPDRSNVYPHVKAMIEALDKSVGQIMATLRQYDLERNTLVVFTSDNGGYLSYPGGFENISSNGHLRGQKTELYEGGHRVPTIVSWLGKIRPGVTHATGHSTDWFPTFARLAGTPIQDMQLDGTDLLPLLTEGKPLPARTLYWRMGARAVRRGPWKLVFPEEGQPELYDLDHDIGESTNLAQRMPERVQALTDAWTKWETDVNQSALGYQQ
jgi:arylsulfatase A-like enzyme